MNRIKLSFKLRNKCLSQSRLFTDDFLLNLYEYITSDEDKERYLDILNTEFRGDIPDKFIEVMGLKILRFVETVET